MANESRTLEIVTRVRDFASRTFASMGANFQHLVGRTFSAGFRAMGGMLRAARSSWLGLGVVIGSVAAAVGAQRGFKNIINAADQLRDLAIATDTSTESLSVLQRALEFTGVRAEQFVGVIRGLSQAQGSALSGGVGSSKARAFSAIGIGIQELRDTAPDELFRRVVEGLSGITSESERTAAAQELFGRRYLDVLATLKLGPAVLEENLRIAREYGAELAGPLADAADAFNDELTKLGIAADSVAREAVLGLLKEMQPLISALAEFIRTNRGQLVQVLQGAIRLLKDFAFWLAEIGIKVLALLAGGGLQRWFDGLIDRLRALNPIARGLAMILEAVFGKQTTASVRAARDEVDQLATSVAAVEETVASLRAVQESGAEDVSGVLPIKEQELADLQLQLSNAANEYDRLARAAAEAEGEIADSLPSETARKALDLARTLAAAREAMIRLRQPGQRQGEPIEDTSGAEQLDVGPDLEVLEARLNDAGVQYQEFLEAQETLAAAKRGRLGLGPIVDPEVERQALETVEGYHNDFFARFGEGIQEASMRWRDFAGAARAAGAQIVDTTLNGLTDAISDGILGTKKWGEAFKEFGKAVLRQLVEIIVKLAIVKALQSVFGGALGEGGVTPGVSGTFALAEGGVTRSVARVLPMRSAAPIHQMPVRAFQQGGVANRPTVAIFGEAGEEAFVPLKNHRIPVEIRGRRESDAGDTFVYAPTVKAWDSKDAGRALWESRREMMAVWRNELRRNKNRNEVREAV